VERLGKEGVSANQLKTKFIFSFFPTMEKEIRSYEEKEEENENDLRNHF